jgi:hypothetical protein
VNAVIQAILDKIENCPICDAYLEQPNEYGANRMIKKCPDRGCGYFDAQTVTVTDDGSVNITFVIR